MKWNILKIIAFFLLIYSISGVLFHALFKLDLTGHYCRYLLLDSADKHLLVYTVTASIAATFFSLLKRRRRRTLIS